MPRPTPRMYEIAARARRACDAVGRNDPEREAIVEEFYRHAMYDIVYLLGKVGVAEPTDSLPDDGTA